MDIISFLDVNSGAVHVVDQEAYDVIAVLNEMNAEHTPETLKAPETETVLKKSSDRYTGGRPEGYSGCGDRADRSREDSLQRIFMKI